MHSGRVVKKQWTNVQTKRIQKQDELYFVFFPTWHSIEVQYEGCHESSLDGEDGDGVGEHHAVGVVEADDHQLGQGSRVGKLHQK